MSATVNLRRIFQYRIDSLPIPILQHAVKAGFTSGMTSNPSPLFHLQHNDIRIAVQPYLMHRLHMAGFLTFVPQFAP